MKNYLLNPYHFITYLTFKVPHRFFNHHSNFFHLIALKEKKLFKTVCKTYYYTSGNVFCILFKSIFKNIDSNCF